MTCSKSLSIVIGPGVNWQNLLWGSATVLDSDGGSSTFSPENTESNTWQGTATAPNGIATGRRSCIGALVYAGPNRSCQAVMQIATNSVAAPAGVCRVSLYFAINSIIQASYTGPVRGFSGTAVLNFTAMTGTLELGFDIVSSQPGGANPIPMNISCTGEVMNL